METEKLKDMLNSREARLHITETIDPIDLTFYAMNRSTICQGAAWRRTHEKRHYRSNELAGG